MDWHDPYPMLWHNNDSKGYGRADSTYPFPTCGRVYFFVRFERLPYTELRPRAVDIEVEKRGEPKLSLLTCRLRTRSGELGLAGSDRFLDEAPIESMTAPGWNPRPGMMSKAAKHQALWWSRQRRRGLSS